MEEDISQQVQCLGISGRPTQCLYAVEAILDSNSLPEKATIVTYVKDRQNPKEEHLFLFWNWCSVPLTIVRNGFASGYTGVGPKSFSFLKFSHQNLLVQHLPHHITLFTLASSTNYYLSY